MLQLTVKFDEQLREPLRVGFAKLCRHVPSIKRSCVGHRCSIVLEYPSFRVLLMETQNSRVGHTEKVAPVVEERADGYKNENSELDAVEEHEEAKTVWQVVKGHLLMQVFNCPFHRLPFLVVLRETFKAIQLVHCLCLCSRCWLNICSHFRTNFSVRETAACH